MIVSALHDAVILFLLIYAIIDLSNQFVHYVTGWLGHCNAKEAGKYLIHLADLSPNCAEYQIRTGMQMNCPVLLITDNCNADTLSIARRLANESAGITLMTQNDFIVCLRDSKVPDAFSADNEEAIPTPDK